MEKFRIAQYGFIQMVALVYGMLGAGTLLKIANRNWALVNLPLPQFFDAIAWYRDYGLSLTLIILTWATFCAYHSTIFSKLNIDEDAIVLSGLILSGIFFVMGTFMIMGGITHIYPPLSAYR